MTSQTFTIGALAKQAGVTVETVRFYQRKGLLAEPQRPFKGIRRYTDRDLQRLRFIKQAQKLGFALDEVAELLSLEDKQQCREAKAIALKKLVLIRERIEALRTMETALSALAESCAGDNGAVSCPIIQALLRASPEAN
jgi:MerR family mercuric resistance operon transcriptional regulator